jgi:hypothetical protein
MATRPDILGEIRHTFRVTSDSGVDVDTAINEHLRIGHILLHVGQETMRTSDGELWQLTVAILGTSYHPT